MGTLIVRKYMALSIIADPHKETTRALATELSQKYGAAPLSKENTLIAIGGDGTLMYAFNQAVKHGIKHIYPILPNDNNSTGFWVNPHTPAIDLKKKIKNAHAYRITPLQLSVTHKSGKKRHLLAFGTAHISNTGGQAALLKLDICNEGECTSYERIMGDGLIFSTPLGSSGHNYSAGGSIVDLGQSQILMVGSNLRPSDNIPPMVKNSKTKFMISPISGQERRPLRIDIDGQTYELPTEDGLESVEIKSAPRKTVTLYLDKPANQHFMKLTCG